MSGGQSWTSYIDANPFMDFNSGGTLLYRYLYGNAIDFLIGRIDTSSNAMWYLTDKLGSVRENTDGSGNVLDSITYDTFGNIIAETHPTSGDRFKYTSREWDSEIGKYFYRARYYSPGDGRYQSEDPTGLQAGDTDFYRYLLNSPVNGVDPRGLCTADYDELKYFCKHRKCTPIYRATVAYIGISPTTGTFCSASDWRKFKIDASEEVDNAYDFAGRVKNWCGSIWRLELVGHGAIGGMQTMRTPWVTFFGLRETGMAGDVAAKLTNDATIWFYTCEGASNKRNMKISREPGHFAQLLNHPVIAYTKDLQKVNYTTWYKLGPLSLSIDEFAGIRRLGQGQWLKYYPDGRFTIVENPSGDQIAGTEEGHWTDDPRFADDVDIPDPPDPPDPAR